MIVNPAIHAGHSMTAIEYAHNQHDVKQKGFEEDHPSENGDLFEGCSVNGVDHNDGVEHKGHGQMVVPESVVLVHLFAQHQIVVVQLDEGGHQRVRGQRRLVVDQIVKTIDFVDYGLLFGVDVPNNGYEAQCQAVLNCNRVKFMFSFTVFPFPSYRSTRSACIASKPKCRTNTPTR